MWSSIQRAGFSALIAALALALYFSEARAAIYQCIDPDGMVLFTDSPTRTGCRLLIGREPERPAAAPAVASNSADVSRFDDLIVSSAERYGVDPALVRAVVKAESGFDETALSRKGAQGLMQLMPGTARLHNVANAYNAEQNIEGGVKHLRLLLDRYQGDLQLTLAAYNAGIQAVEKYRGIPPFSETREYVRRVLDFHQHYRKDAQLASGGERR